VTPTSPWQTLLIALGIFAVLVYVVLPVVIRFTLHQSANPDLVCFRADDSELPTAVTDHLQNVIEELKPLGFEPVEGLFLPNASPRVKAFVFLLVHRANKDNAFAMAAYAQMPDGYRLRTAHLEISTRFRDGSLVSTSNSKVSGSFPLRPRQTKTRLPIVQDGARLYRLHQAVLKRHEVAAGKILRLDEEFHGDVAAYLHQSMEEELEDAAAAGYMYRSGYETVYRPTWKGAFLMCWAQTWPFKMIRQAQIHREGRRLLDQLEAV
jgi:hypothetical protein